MLVTELNSALSALTTLPKGIKVSIELWNALRDAQLIEMAHPLELSFSGPDFKFPFYRGIYIAVDPDRDSGLTHFSIPSTSSKTLAHNAGACNVQSYAPGTPQSTAEWPRSKPRWLGRS